MVCEIYETDFSTEHGGITDIKQYTTKVKKIFTVIIICIKKWKGN
jgi:hypothetical protein